MMLKEGLDAFVRQFRNRRAFTAGLIIEVVLAVFFLILLVLVFVSLKGTGTSFIDKLRSIFTLGG